MGYNREGSQAGRKADPHNCAIRLVVQPEDFWIVERGLKKTRKKGDVWRTEGDTKEKTHAVEGEGIKRKASKTYWGGKQHEVSD